MASAVAPVHINPGAQPQRGCVRQQPFTTEALAVFARRSIASSATVVSDGLWCFGALQSVGTGQEQVVTVGRMASVKPPAFKAVYTFLGNLKRSFGSTYTTLTSPRRPIATSQRHSTASKIALLGTRSWLAYCALPAFHR